MTPGIRIGSSSVAALAVAAVLGAGVPPVAAGSTRDADRAAAHRVWPRIVYPSRRALRHARAFAAARGDVSFAVIGPYSGLRGYATEMPYSSASVSKALLLAAELRRLQREDLPLDRETRALLEPMVIYSDNHAADAIYARVGDAGLAEVARHAGMRDFEPVPGFWGGDRITAADTARFFERLEANLPRLHRAYAKGLLARITPVERWGIPRALGPGWSIWFKGGWRPPGHRHNTGPVTHQAGLLVHRNGERLALAVLSNEPPASGFGAIEGIAERLLAKPPPYRDGWIAP